MKICYVIRKGIHDRREAVQTILKKLKFHIRCAELTTLDQNWDTDFFNPVYRYIYYSRLYMPCSGEGRMVCGKQSFRIRKGSMFLVPPYAHIRVRCPKRLVKYWCHFTASVAGFDNDIFSMLPNVTEIKISDAQFAANRKLFERLLAVPKNSTGELTPDPLDELCANAALALLVEPFLKLIPQKTVLHNDADLIMKLIQYMNENMSSQITLRSLAKIAGLHPNYLSSLFSRSTGISPIAYLLRLRLGYAMMELRRGVLRIGEIAEKIGISNHSEFSQFFHRRTGFSPREWQKRYKQGLY